MKLFHRLLLPLIAVVVTWCASNTHWKDGRFILIGDAQGYYSYLPAVFIYQDLNFGFYDTMGTKYFTVSKYDYRAHHNGKVVNKYFCGTAVAMMPFFGIAHLLTPFTDEPADGFSKYYTIFAQIACIVWLLIGLVYLRKILRLYTGNENIISFVLIAIVFGTNIFYYNISEPGVSHIFSFAFINMFAWYCKRFIDAGKDKYLLYCFLLLGMIVLLRPVNLLILAAIPFLCVSKEAMMHSLSQIISKKPLLITGLLLFFLIISIQLVLYKLSSGSWYINTYGNEGFEWTSFNLFDFLFSYKKGMFLYTPLLLISLAGGYWLWKRNKYEFYALSGFLLLLVYVLSSWWQWYYGGSFSSRVMIEYYAFFTILLVFAFESVKQNVLRLLLPAFVTLLIIFCQIQTYQYRYNHIHWSEMNKERYWKVFLRVDLLMKHENPNADLLNK